jgi:hypothetical protein
VTTPPAVGLDGRTATGSSRGIGLADPDESVKLPATVGATR